MNTYMYITCTIAIHYGKIHVLSHNDLENVHVPKYYYRGTSLIQTPLGQMKVSLLVRCPDFRGCNAHMQGGC